MHINWRRGETRTFAFQHSDRPHWWSKRRRYWRRDPDARAPLESASWGPHRRPRSTHDRPWVIEVRWGRRRSWDTWRRYRREHERDEALAALQHRVDVTPWGSWKFRAGQPESDSPEG